MKKERLLLMISAIMMILFIVFNCAYTIFFEKGKILTKLDIIIDIFFYITSLLGTILFIYFANTKKDIGKYKILIIFISVLFFLYNIVSGVLGFIASSKIEKSKKRELPKLDIQNNYKWYIYLIVFAIAIIIMFVLSNYFKNKYQLYGSYLFILILVLFVFRKDLIRDFKYFKNYFREYNSYVFKMYGISLVILFILSISIRLYTGLDNATNQTSLNLLFSQHPVLVILLSVVYAPLAEELLFRGIFRKIINKKWLFILISGIVFGAAHVLDDFQSIKELLFILVYSNLGCFLAAVYYKTNNLCANIYFHFLQNSFSVLALILLTFLT